MKDIFNFSADELELFVAIIFNHEKNMYVNLILTIKEQIHTTYFLFQTDCTYTYSILSVCF